MTDAGFQIAVSILANEVDNELPLEERFKETMKYMLENESDIFFMMGRVDDTMKFKTALGAVMIKANDEEKEAITKSLAPLNALGAAMAGVPVDFENIDMEGILPLHKWWIEIKREKEKENE